MSDGIIVACPLSRGEGHITPILVVQDIFLTLATILPLQLATMHPRRGGMDVGLGIEVEGELFGAGLVKAYRLESTRADYPRVVVGQNLMEYVAAMAATPVADRELQYAQLVGQSCLEFIATDDDGDWIFDYAGSAATQIYNALPLMTTPHPIVEARRFAMAKRASFEAAGDNKHFNRYTKLVNYFNKRAGLWGIQV